MPIVERPSYAPPLLFRNGHLNTMYVHLFRKVKTLPYERVRIETPDDDFLDLDFSTVGSDTLVILVHGLEGSSNSIYIKGMAQAVNSANWDALSMNLRSCSGELNRLFSSYHSGRSDDLDTVIQYVLSLNKYSRIMLVGFSLGGNIVLKYMGEMGATISPIVVAAVGVSVPCDLRSSSIHLRKYSNKIYYERLVHSLKKKAIRKKELFPDAPYGTSDVKKVKTFHDFDDLYTAPAHGYQDADDYYEKCSSKPLLVQIKTPTLLINALDDPFLPEACYPFEEAKSSDHFFLEAPKYGGHVGFDHKVGPKLELWHETRTIAFFQKLLKEYG